MISGLDYFRELNIASVLLRLVLAMAFAVRAIVARPAPSPAAIPATGQGVERPDLQQRAAQAVESARVPGAGTDLSITVVQDGATPPAR